jgi:hypothetical protein
MEGLRELNTRGFYYVSLGCPTVVERDRFIVDIGCNCG